MHSTVYLDDLRCDGSAHGVVRPAASCTGKRNGSAAWIQRRIRQKRPTTPRLLSRTSPRRGRDGVMARRRRMALPGYRGRLKPPNS